MTERRQRLALLLSGVLVACSGRAAPAVAQQPPAIAVRPAAAGPDGRLPGFDLCVAGRVVAPIRFSSQGLITAGQCRQDGPVLRFLGLRAKEGTGLRLAADDGIEVRTAEGAYPEVRFRLTIAAFDPVAWERGAGRFPLHFLTLCLPDAEVVHQRGWLNATPKADPFPFLLDVHAGTPEICANWSRNWSYAVPVGCYPLPVAGLWAPSRRLYVGYDFLPSRLAEQSERYLATAYCWQEEKGDSPHLCEAPSGPFRQMGTVPFFPRGQFVALVYPYAGRGFQTLTYPKPPERIEGRFRLMVSTEMGPTADPNAWLQEDYFRRYAAEFPRVPAASDLGWMPGGARLGGLPPAPRGRLLERHAREDTFEAAGTVEIGGWTWHRQSAVTAAYRRGDRPMLDALKQDIEYLRAKAQRVTIDGQECLFWPKPIEGQWLERWGGRPVATLHNANGWAAGIVLVDFYRHDKTADYLPLIDGIYNWTRHFVWTRNEFADVPSSPFAIGGTLSAAFLLDYYYAFKDDPLRGERAEQAVELARQITYRYMIAWACDNDRQDNLDSSFLWEPNSGRDWVGTACANELHWNLDTLTQVYVNCGDPILNYYLRGALERWHLLYKDLPADKIADYPADALSEWLGLFDGTMAGRGGRAPFGTGDILPLNYPVGRSVLCVACGRKAALACSKGGVYWRIEDYRYAPEANFAFTVRSRRKDAFDLTLSFPFADLTDRPVSLARGKTVRPLEPGKDLVRSADAPSYIYVRGLQDGDTLSVGRVAGDAPVLPLGNPWTQRPPSDRELLEPPFQMLRLPPGERLPRDWDDTASFAGLWPGRHWAWGVPFDVPLAEEDATPLALGRPCTLRLPAGAASIYLVFAPGGPAGTLRVERPGKPAAVVAPADCAMAWRSWPPCFRQKILMARLDASGGDALEIIPEDSQLLAVTVLTDASQEPRLRQVFQTGKGECQAMLAEERKIRALAVRAQRARADHIAILPAKTLAGPVVAAMRRSGLMKKCRQLTPAEMLDPDLLTARRFPVLLNLGGEEYAGTIRRAGDGGEAILRYLRSGGSIVMLTSGPLPFYYDTLDGPPRVRSLTPQMGLPIGLGFEQPPPGGPLEIRWNSEQKLITGMPAAIAFSPRAELRLRSIARQEVSPDAVYTPIFTVTGPGGTRYGDAAAEARFIRGPFRGGRLIYVWSGLLGDRQLGSDIIEQMLNFLIAQSQQ
ncbi:MAG: hypothetical protein ABSG86_17235 [Thermoguttaceae bacterium]|jgi:hypothetical protein